MRTDFSYKTWSSQETELAEKLVMERAPEEVFQQLLGRTRQACRDRLRRLDSGIGKFRDAGPPVPKIIVPPEVIEDRNRRLMARHLMSLAAQIMGDPEPGRRRA